MARNSFLARADRVLISRARFLKNPRSSVNNMATVMCFRLLFGRRCRAHGKYFNGLFTSICHKSSSPSSLLQRHVCAFSPTRSSQDKSHEKDRSFFRRVPYGFLGLGGVFCSVVWGSLHAECVGEETCCENKNEVDGKTPKTPPSKIDSGVVRDKSGRFSSSDKKQKQDQKYSRALGLLKGDMVKRKLHFDGEEERKNEGQPNPGEIFVLFPFNF